MNPARTFACVAAAAAIALMGVTNALAANVIVVTPANSQGWSTADTRPGGAVTFVSDPSSPYPSGALQLTTDATTTAKAQYLHAADLPLSLVTDLSYYTKQVSPPGPVADPSYQLIMCLNGGSFATTCNGFTTLVFEPYQNVAEGPIVSNAWQKWDVANGMFWSTRSATCSNGLVAGTSGGPASYSLAAIETLCPNANVAGFGVNIGSNNPGYNVLTDGFDFNGTVYDFQLANTPKSKEDCKDGGWANRTDDQGNTFKNQGQCVSFFNHHGGDGQG